MILFITLDKSNGYLFNNRRLSSDKEVIKRICDMSEDLISIDSRSIHLFSDYLDKITLGESNIRFEEFIIPDVEKFDEIYVFRWMRNYPSDVKVDLSAFKKRVIDKFPGNSHEKIYLERYTK